MWKSTVGQALTQVDSPSCQQTVRWQLSQAAMKVEELSGTRREAWNCVRVQCDAHLTIAGVQLCAKNRTTLLMSTVGRQHAMHETESRWPIFVNRFSSRKVTHFSRNVLFSTVRNEVLPPLLTTSISEPSAPRHARASRGGRWRPLEEREKSDGR